MPYSGKFTPRNTSKYLGDVRNVVYRSLWERKFMKYCDETPGVTKWSSEELIIPYISPVDGQQHRYFPDFKIEVLTKDGSTKTMVIEIKPKKQQSAPKAPKRRTPKYLTEVATYTVNIAKWQAAEKFCKSRGWQFLVLNETHLDIHASR